VWLWRLCEEFCTLIVEESGLKDWNGRNVVVLGAARQGLALARYLALHGAQVVLNDQRHENEMESAITALADLQGRTAYPVRWVLGKHPLEILEEADLLCVSGGVPLTLPIVKHALERGVPVTNDSQIFLEAAPCPVVGITGSAGKTTTTTLVGRMAQAAVASALAGGKPRQAWVGGNIGSPLIAILDEIAPQDLAIMELSSFQLELMTRSPQIAAVLNITPNHLDRHGSMAAYTAAKAHILAYQAPVDTAVLGRDDPGAWSLADQVRGALMSFSLEKPQPGQSQPDPSGIPGTFSQDGELFFSREGELTWLMSRSAVGLRGEHNLLNVLAACAISLAAHLPLQALREGVDGFGGVPHRLEFVRSWGGADWYNDSIATAPERTIAAIRSFEEPLVLLVGGRDKDLPWEELAELARKRVRRLIIFGEAAGKIIHAMEAGGVPKRPDMIRCAGLKEAVQAASQIMRPGDVVLLSPGGTSFDEFRDFEERGECFKQLVMQL
jgi:UDP-N-acetylmuramoylalanine--D-glutamate ligase